MRVGGLGVICFGRRGLNWEMMNTTLCFEYGSSGTLVYTREESFFFLYPEARSLPEFSFDYAVFIQPMFAFQVSATFLTEKMPELR